MADKAFKVKNNIETSQSISFTPLETAVGTVGAVGVTGGWNNVFTSAAGDYIFGSDGAMFGGPIVLQSVAAGMRAVLDALGQNSSQSILLENNVQGQITEIIYPINYVQGTDNKGDWSYDIYLDQGNYNTMAQGATTIKIGSAPNTVISSSNSGTLSSVFSGKTKVKFGSTLYNTSIFTISASAFETSNTVSVSAGQVIYSLDETPTGFSSVKLDGTSGASLGYNKITDKWNVNGKQIAVGVIDDTSANIAFGDSALDSLDGTGVQNIAIGASAATALTEGDYNIAIGVNTLKSGTTARQNVAIGQDALRDTTAGQDNIAIGHYTLRNQAHASISHNIAIGSSALKANSNTNGVLTHNIAIGGLAGTNLNGAQRNIAIGFYALRLNVSGNGNIAIGHYALYQQQGSPSNGSIAIGERVLRNWNSNGQLCTGVGFYALNAATSAVGLTGFGAAALRSTTTGSFGTAVGYYAGHQVTTGQRNTAVGFESLKTITTGTANIAIGYRAMYNTTNSINYTIAIGENAAYSSQISNVIAIGREAVYGPQSTAANLVGVGHYALRSVTTGFGSVGVGPDALRQMTTGYANTAVGYYAGKSLTTGEGNTLVGHTAGQVSTTAGARTFVGQSAGQYNTGGSNVGVGAHAVKGLSGQTNTGTRNTGVGYGALRFIYAGNDNTGLGYNAIYQVAGGLRNTAVGSEALGGLDGVSDNTAVGYRALLGVTTGQQNTAIGGYAGRTGTNNITTGSNNTLIGYYSQATSSTVSNQITLGNSSIATLRCQVTSITALSDARDKKNISTSEYGLELVKLLRPVTFEWAMRDGGKVGIKDIGFIAQELAEIEDSLGAHDTLALTYRDNPEKLEASYGRLVPVLVKAIQELSAKVELLEARGE